MSASIPDSVIDELALRLLHGLADDAEREELARLLACSADNRRRFLDHAGLHAMLAREGKAGSLSENPHVFFGGLEKAARPKPNRLLRYWLPAAAALLAVGLTAVFLLPTKAMAALDRVIVAMDAARDRTYRIEVVEAAPEQETTRPDRGRFPPANHLDGASLWLRGPGEFVLRQTLPNGEIRILGGDGTQSWSLRGGGPVRVSPDPNRFGRAIFEPNGEVAFLNLRSQLEELKRIYRIEWIDQTSREIRKLRGVRHSHDQGGPREIELWFRPDTGVLERMILRHLPRGNGGPRSIAVILHSTDPLPADFFQHQSHHEAGRDILAEP